MSLAGYSISFGVIRNTLLINIVGYCDKITNIFEEVIDWLFNTVDKELNNIKEDIYQKLYNDYRNLLRGKLLLEPYKRLSKEFSKKINDKHSYSDETILNVLEKFSTDKIKNSNTGVDLINFRKIAIHKLSKGFIKGIFGGSINFKVCDRIIDILQKHIKKGFMPEKIDLKLGNKKGIDHYVIDNKNKHDDNIGVIYGVYLGNISESDKSDKSTKLYLYFTLLNRFASD